MFQRLTGVIFLLKLIQETIYITKYNTNFANFTNF